jgi:hypothetical protein
VQWRLDRKTERYGWEIRTETELEPVREVVLPLGAIAGAAVRAGAWHRVMGPSVVLTARDLRAFEEIAGSAGLRLDHPATLRLNIPRNQIQTAREFVADLNLALAQQDLRLIEEPSRAPQLTSRKEGVACQRENRAERICHLERKRVKSPKQNRAAEKSAARLYPGSPIALQ